MPTFLVSMPAVLLLVLGVAVILDGAYVMGAVVGAVGTLALLNLAGLYAIPVGALILTAAAASVIAIRRELRRQGRI